VDKQTVKKKNLLNAIKGHTLCIIFTELQCKLENKILLGIHMLEDTEIENAGM
jgi:hypothetical protein